MRKLAALLVGRNIAQMVERLTFNQRVTGSSPVVPDTVTRLCGFLFWIGGENLSLSILTG